MLKVFSPQYHQNKQTRTKLAVSGTAINSLASDQALSELEESFGPYWPGLSISSEDISINQEWVKHCPVSGWAFSASDLS